MQKLDILLAILCGFGFALGWFIAGSLSFTASLAVVIIIVALYIRQEYLARKDKKK